MNFILDRLGVNFHDEENLPEVVVLVISGPTLAIPQEQVVSGFVPICSTAGWTGRSWSIGSARWPNWCGSEADAFPPPTRRWANP